MRACSPARAKVGTVSVLAAGLAALAVFAGQVQAATITLGQTGTGVTCGSAATLVQTGVSGGNSYTVPSGSWKITSWSTEAGSPGGQMALVVYRPTATAHEYKVVAATAAQSLTASTLNTFSVSINVAAGDLIGYWCSAGTTGASNAAAGDTFESVLAASVPTVGSTVTFASGTSLRLDIRVILTQLGGGGGGGGGGTEEPPPPPPPEPARLGVCDRTGVFRNIYASQYKTTDTTSPYYGAVAARYYEGLGITCDILPGYTDAGYTVDGTGAKAPAGYESVWLAPYEYYTKNA